MPSPADKPETYNLAVPKDKPLIHIKDGVFVLYVPMNKVDHVFILGFIEEARRRVLNVINNMEMLKAHHEKEKKKTGIITGITNFIKK